MNKEEFIDTLQACYFGDRGAFNKILKEYEELHNKIDKAIEYIENNSLYYEDYDYDYEENPYLAGIDDCYAKRDLLEILKDSDVDE